MTAGPSLVTQAEAPVSSNTLMSHRRSWNFHHVQSNFLWVTSCWGLHVSHCWERDTLHPPAAEHSFLWIRRDERWARLTWQ